jgi:hypothetical protein
MHQQSLVDKINDIPIGYTEVYFQGRKYGLSRTVFNQGRSTKVYAEELGGNDFISFNFYCTTNKELLKPCEMPTTKVLDFINNYMLSNNDNEIFHDDQFQPMGDKKVEN